MKNLKKIFALAIVVAMSLVAFTGCTNCFSIFNSKKISEADAQKMSGTWELVAATMDGTTLPSKDLGVSMDFVFNQNGKATYVLNGQSEEYKWEMEGDLITIWVPEGGVNKGHTAVLDGNHFDLYWNYNGQSLQMIFAKKGTDDMDPNKYVTAAPATQNNTQPTQPATTTPSQTPSTSSLAGTYEFSSRLYNGKWWSPADSEVFDCYLTLNPEGSFVLSIYGNKTTGIYEYDGNSLSLVVSPTPDGVTNCTVDGNTITVNNPPGNYPSIEALKFTK